MVLKLIDLRFLTFPFLFFFSKQQHEQRSLIIIVNVILYNIVKPKFVVTPEDVDVQDGSSARLDCEVTGYPRPVITWTFNDGPVDRQRTGIYI